MKKNVNRQPGLAEDSGVQKNMLIFKAIGVAIPFVLLVIIEVSLRLFSYGDNLDLFINSKNDSNYLVFNPYASRKYFTDPTIATAGNTERFKKKKDNNTCRIFVLGESTTIGYPYFYNASFHRWLQYRLTYTFPEKNFEIINLSLTAVNSYTVLDFAKELVNYQPDAVLIYVGQNEYYGALGVGSTQSLGDNPFLTNIIIELRTIKTVQLITNLYRKVTQFFRNKTVDPDSPRMKVIVANQKIPFKSHLYQLGIEQFRYNIGKTLKLFGEKNIPVFLSNLVSNEKDLPPFITTPENGQLPASFTTKYNSGLKALAARDTISAQSCFREANQVFHDHAQCNFYLGRIAFSTGDFQNAKTYFERAKDLDLLRFRAPAELNQIIGQLSAQYKSTYLVDAKGTFERHSPNNIIGDNLIIDHVHPNLQGYSLLSDAFYEALKSARLIKVSPETEMSYDQLVKQMPISSVDSLAGVFRIRNLKRRWPFNDPAYKIELPVNTLEEKLARKLAFEQMGWQVVNKSLFAYYEQNKRFSEASKITEAMVLENPTNQPLYELTGKYSIELNDYKKGIFYLKKSFYMAPTFDKAKYLMVILLQEDHPTEALPFLNYAIANNSEGFNLGPVKNSVEKIIELQKVLLTDSLNITVLNRVAEGYQKIFNRDGAMKYLSQVLKLDPRNMDAKTMVNQINQHVNYGKN